MKKTVDEIIDENLRVLSDPEDDDAVQTAREIVCIFYGKGGNTDCKGCTKPDEKVLECKDTYVDRIKVRPMEVWSPQFDEIEVREKKSLNFGRLTLRCDKCNISDVCPEYKQRATCSIDFGDTDTSNNKVMMDKLIEIQTARVNFARSSEAMDGGQPDQTLSNEMDRLQGMLAARADMTADKFSISIEGKSQGNAGGGILSQLFGGMSKQPDNSLPANQTIPIDAEIVEDNNAKKPLTLDVNKVEFIEEPKLRDNKKLDPEPEPVAKARPSKRATIIKKPKDNED